VIAGVGLFSNVKLCEKWGAPILRFMMFELNLTEFFRIVNFKMICKKLLLDQKLNYLGLRILKKSGKLGKKLGEFGKEKTDPIKYLRKTRKEWERIL
jgi:hypothetical protein